MSQAFVRESDGEWLHDIAPSLNALQAFLTRENNGVRVYEKKRFYSEKFQGDVNEMSNGMQNAKDSDGRWVIAG
jgi:hypothetical protein